MVSLYTSQTPVSGDVSDATEYTLGTVVRCTSAGYECTHLRRYCSVTAPGGPVDGVLYDIAGTELARATFPAHAGAGWQEAELAAAVALTQNAYYVASYVTPDRFVLTQNMFTTGGITNGVVEAPQSGVPHGNGRVGVGDIFPAGTASQDASYFADWVISEAAAEVDGTLELTAPAPTVSMAGDPVNPATLAATAPAASVSSAGDVVHGGMLAATAPAPTVSLAGGPTTDGALAATAPAATVDVTGTSDAATIGSLVAMPTTTVTIYAPTSIDEWSGGRTGDAAVASGVPASIIEQARTVNDPRTGTARVIRHLTGRVPDGAPVDPNSRLVDARGRVYAVSSVRQLENPLWVGDVVLELTRLAQLSP
jgi:hypothetical protein